MAKLDTPSVRGLYDAFIADYENRTGQRTTLLKSAFIRLLAWPFAGLTVLNYRHGNWIYFQMFIATCDEEALRMYGERVDITIGTGAYAQGTVQLTSVTALSIPAGAQFISPDGNVFQSSTDSDVVDGVANVAVKAQDTGSNYELNIGDEMLLSSPISGVPDTGYVTNVSVEGEDDEALEAYRLRVQNRYRRQPQGGSPHDYYLWATEVDAIVDAYPYVFDAGVVHVYPVEEGSGYERVPSSTKILEVIDHITRSPDSDVDDRQPVQSTLIVTAPNVRYYDVTITGLTNSANTAENRADMKDSIINYLDSKKPNIPALDYTEADATVSNAAVSAAAMEVLDASSNSGAFSTIDVKVNGVSTGGKNILPTGTIAVLGTLRINGTIV